MSATLPVKIERIDPALPAARRLIALSDQLMSSLYPAESNHLDGVAALQAPNVSFFGGFVGAELVACGAVKVQPDDPRCAELKRVFVAEEHRGRGLSKAIMAALEGHMAALGVTTARLETGILQPQALGLYARLGYVECAPFGHYQPDPLSMFMEKRIEPAAQ